MAGSSGSPSPAPASRPETIFADESTGNLDSHSGAEVLGSLRASVLELGQGVMMVTHDPAAASYTDRVVFLADGWIADLFHQPTADTVLDRMLRLSPAPSRHPGPGPTLGWCSS